MAHTGAHTHGTPQAEAQDAHCSALAHQNAHQICIILRKSNILHKLLVPASPAAAGTRNRQSNLEEAEEEVGGQLCVKAVMVGH